MTAAERLKLIRARLAKPASVEIKPAGLNRAAHGEAARTRTYSPPLQNPQGSYDVFGVLLPKAVNRKAGWLRVPVKENPKPLAPKRVKRVHHLTRIAQQLPMKLAKIMQH